MEINIMACICLVPIIAGTNTYRHEGYCKHYELLQCGNRRGYWDICSAKTQDVKRILSAQLDTRYENRNCHQYGSEAKFGLTNSGRGMWTIGGCYGAFLLCLEMDSSEETTHSDENMIYYIESTTGDEEEVSNGTAYTGVWLESINNSDANKNAVQSNGTTRIVTTEVININDSKATTVYNPDSFNFNESSTKKDMPSEESPSDTITGLTRFNTSNVIMFNNIETSESENSNQPLKMKLSWIIMIVAGGIVISALIVIICFLSFKCDRKPTKETTIKEPHTDRYFRQPICSTTILLASESDNYADVYDCIPADRCNTENVASPFLRGAEARTAKEIKVISNYVLPVDSVHVELDNNIYHELGNELSLRVDKNSNDKATADCAAICDMDYNKGTHDENVYEEFGHQTNHTEIGKRKGDSSLDSCNISDNINHQVNHDYFILAPEVLKEARRNQITHVDLQPDSCHTYDHLIHVTKDCSTYDHVSFEKRLDCADKII